MEEEQSPPLITMNHSAPVASKTTAAISGNTRGGFITLKPLTGQKKKKFVKISRLICLPRKVMSLHHTEGFSFLLGE